MPYVARRKMERERVSLDLLVHTFKIKTLPFHREILKAFACLEEIPVSAVKYSFIVVVGWVRY